jgi:hypothetical protein
MIDTRAVAQEVQDQLHAAVQRGQDQMRKSQEQMRKSREAVADVIRTGNQLAKTVRPSIPTLPKANVHVPSLHGLADPAKLRASAQELSEHVMATQRSLADKAVKAATPMAEQFVARQRELADKAVKAATPMAEQFVARQRELADKAVKAATPMAEQFVARLTHVVGTLQDVRKPGRDRAAAPEAVSAAETVAPVETHAAVVEADTTEPTKAPAKPRAAKPRTATARTGAAKAGSRESVTGKTAPARKSAGASTSKARTLKK